METEDAKQRMKKLLFTDLDGSLLDHHNYDYSPALPALKMLESEQVPCVFTTSKTAAEVIDIRNELNITAPFIVENGAGVFWPANSISRNDLPDDVAIESWNAAYDYVRLSSISLPGVLELSDQLRAKFGFSYIGMSEMTVEQVIESTGLSYEQAEKAKLRTFSEPILWQDSEANLSMFRSFIEPHGLQVIKGGRFVHLMGKANKGKALKFLKQFYEKRWDEDVTTIALGDGENDIPLLEAGDTAIVIRSPVNKPPKITHSKKKTTRAYGPTGWNKAVTEWLSK